MQAIPFEAFGTVPTEPDIFNHCQRFAGFPVEDYDPTRSGVVFRFSSQYDEDHLVPDLKAFMQSPAAATAPAVVIGCWQPDDSSEPPDEVIAALTAGRSHLPALTAIYLGDVVREECEMSWINQSDVSPLLDAFPHLQYLRTRGGEGLALGSPRHQTLRALACEAGGLDASFIRSLAISDFPNLEYLELWLGTDDYGGTATVADLQPLLSGKLFPRLRYLGLRNAQIADEVAAAVVDCPLLQRLEILDLSLGVLTNTGAEALLKLRSPSLKRLDLHYNYISQDLIGRLEALPLNVDASRPVTMDLSEEYRFVAVGE